MPQPTPGYVLVNESSWHRWEPPQYRLAPEAVEEARRAVNDPNTRRIEALLDRVLTENPYVLEGWSIADRELQSQMDGGALFNRPANPLPMPTRTDFDQMLEYVERATAAIQDNFEREALRQEYLTWRRKRKLEPTIVQAARFKRWAVLLAQRPDMPGIGIHEDGSG